VKPGRPARGPLLAALARDGEVCVATTSLIRAATARLHPADHAEARGCRRGDRNSAALIGAAAGIERWRAASATRWRRR